MKKPCLVTLFTCVLSLSAHADDSISAEKIKLIETLLVQTGQTATEMGNHYSINFSQHMVHILQQSQPDINPKAFTIIEEESSALINEELITNDAFNKMMYPIYNKNFTEDELKKMIEINNTELGKKMLKVFPVISQEAMLAGQEFGLALAPRIQKRIISRFQEEGIF